MSLISVSSRNNENETSQPPPPPYNSFVVQPIHFQRTFLNTSSISVNQQPPPYDLIERTGTIHIGNFQNSSMRDSRSHNLDSSIDQIEIQLRRKLPGFYIIFHSLLIACLSIIEISLQITLLNSNGPLKNVYAGIWSGACGIGLSSCTLIFGKNILN